MSAAESAAGDVLLSVRDLRVEFRTGNRVVHAVNGVSLDVRSGETLGHSRRERLGQEHHVRSGARHPGFTAGLWSPAGEAVFEGEESVRL